FAERAVAEMLAVSKFPDWNAKKHYLDVGQMAYGVGIGYDWLYHFMSDAERKTVRDALYNYAIQTGMNHWCHNITSNWNPWCMAGLAIAATAIYEDYPQDCGALLAKSVTSIQNSLALFTPMGAYPEAPGYYRIGSEFSAIYFETMRSVLGTDFGVSDLPGVRESGRYLLAMNGNVNSFNFGDCSEAIIDGAMLHWYASRFNMPELSVYQRKFQSHGEVHDEVLSLLWYDPTLVEGVTAEAQQLDYLMYCDEYQSVASFRSYHADPNQIYAAIKSGYNSTSHADMDIGTFVMEAMGERWFMDLGSDDYNLPEYGKFSNGYTDDIGRWTYYRKRTEGHNTLVVNPDHRGGQDAKSACQITGYKSSFDGGYATVDMLDAYDAYGVKSANRGLMLFDERSRVLLRDELVCASPSEVYWFAHTKANISISADGKTAELTMNGKTLLAQLVSPANGVFTQMEAQALPTSPNPEGQKSNAGIRKLAIHLKNVTATEITVVFTPVLEEADRKKSLPSVTLETLSAQLKDYDEQTALTPNAKGEYEIYNVEQLCLLSRMVGEGERFENKTFKLMNDIDMGGRTFRPIGGGGDSSASTPFHGTFDGGGHIIKNLCIFEPSKQDVGFFGKLSGASIRNLGIESGIVFGSQRVAGLSGTASNTTIENCYNKATVIASSMHAGGLVGQLSYRSTVRNSYNNARIKSYSQVSGGVVGYISSKSEVQIENCYHVGNLTDTLGRSGLIGFYQTAGGEYLVGKVTVTNCYATTPIKGKGTPDSAEHESYSNCATVTEAELVSAALSLGNSFIDDCEWENDGYPVFTWQCNTRLPEDLSLRTEAELRFLAYQVNSGATDFSGKTVSLCNDIDLNSREWIPIGGSMPTDTAGKRFRGTFDGKGYAVKNLRISTNRYYNGFFGAVNGKILHFGIKSGYVTGMDKVGGIAGNMGGTSTIDNCYNRASVQGRSFVGGVIGMAAKTTIRNCYNTGTITATNEAGGIVGYFASDATGASIGNCYNAGPLSGAKKGGIAATFHSKLNGIPVTNCYSLQDHAQFYDQWGYTATNCATCTEAVLKTKASDLGTAYATDSLLQTNEGYPVLNCALYGSNVTLLQPAADGVYYIGTEQQLRSLAYMVNVERTDFAGKTVVLTSDLDLKNREWFPIGGNTHSDEGRFPFKGAFDGGGHIITNMRITSGNCYVGLFGYAGGPYIKNLGLENGMVIGYGKVAALVGATVGNIQITDCYSKVNVSGWTAVGGIVGMVGANRDTIRNCYNMGVVDANDSVAGIAGYLASGADNVKLENCYNVGVHSLGLVGNVNSGATAPTMTNCYTIDTVEPVGTAGTLTVTNCGKVDAQTLRSYDDELGSGFAPDYLAQNRIYPVLAWQNGDATGSLKQVNGIYQVTCADELRLLSYLVRTGTDFRGKTVLLTADIDLENKPWLSIGGYMEGGNKFFRGTFDGGGHTVSNIYVWDMTEEGFIGLFGIASTGSIRNVGIESGIIIGTQRVGGIAGNLTGGASINGCYNKATLYGRHHVGGLVGMVNTNSYIKNSYNIAPVYSKNVINSSAGLVGYIASKNTGFLIENCYDVGNYNAVLCEINDTSVNTVIRNTYSVDSIRLVRKSPGHTLEGNTRMVSAQTLKTFYTDPLSEFTYDHNLSNQGYPVLRWEKSGQHPETELRGYVAPTLTEKGSRGKIYCLVCGDYVGQGETLEVLDKSLFFTFDNTQKDIQRYQNTVYGEVYFDDPNELHWAYNSKLLSGLTLGGGALTFHVRGEYDPSITYPGVYVDTYSKEVNGKPLYYDPAEAEVWQMRFKIEGMAKVGNPYVDLHLTGLDKNGKALSNTDLNQPNKGFAESVLTDGQYIIVTVPVNTATLENCSIITTLRPYFGQIKSLDPDKGGKISIDYIYLGTYASLPTKEYTVTFVDVAGKELQKTTVYHGQSVKYTGKTPTKEIDSTYHYLFTGWDQPLDNVTSHMTVKPVFKADKHDFKKVVTAPECEKGGYTTYTCNTCGYSYVGDETLPTKHTEAIRGAVAPTCTDTGLTEGRYCSVCQKTLVEQQVIPASGHKAVIDKAISATCTTPGKTEGKHCSTCNTVLVKQETVAPLGHSYTTKVTAPTCTAQGYTTYTCSRCSHSYKDNYVNAKGHTEVIDKAVAATCTTAGKTEGKHCSVCNTVLTAQETIPATGHTEVIDKAIPAT
ncbi:MAG: heparinase II/III family protein, partial [Oscillospiraceae bacterium]|nr:heparinase II/III family protein [Oscillospiraceae bacterium]